MLSFEKATKEEKETLTARGNYSESTALIENFAKSGTEVAKVTGYSMTEAIKVYNRLVYPAYHTVRDLGVKVSKRGQNIYLINTKLNPVAEALEKR